MLVCCSNSVVALIKIDVYVSIDITKMRARAVSSFESGDFLIGVSMWFDIV